MIKKLFFQFLFFWAILIIVLLSLAPLLTQTGFYWWFKQQGIKAEIKSLSIAFARGKVKLNDLQINHSVNKLLSIEKLLIDISLLNLIKGELIIDQLYIQGAYIDLLNKDQNLSVAALETIISNNNDRKLTQNFDKKLEKNNGQNYIKDIIIKNIELNDIESCIHFEDNHLKDLVCLDLSKFSINHWSSISIANKFELNMPSISLEKFSINSEVDLFTFKNFDLEDVEFVNDELKINKIKFEKISLFEKDKRKFNEIRDINSINYGITLNQLRIEKLLLKENYQNLNLDKLFFDNLNINLVRTNDKTIDILDRLNYLKDQFSINPSNKPVAIQVSSNDSYSNEESKINFTVNQFLISSFVNCLFKNDANGAASICVGFDELNLDKIALYKNNEIFSADIGKFKLDELNFNENGQSIFYSKQIISNYISHDDEKTIIDGFAFNDLAVFPYQYSRLNSKSSFNSIKNEFDKNKFLFSAKNFISNKIKYTSSGIDVDSIYANNWYFSDLFQRDNQQQLTLSIFNELKMSWIDSLIYFESKKYLPKSDLNSLTEIQVDPDNNVYQSEKDNFYFILKLIEMTNFNVNVIDINQQNTITHNFVDLNLTVNNINSKNKDKKGTIDFSGIFNGYGKILANGFVKPFLINPEVNLDISGKSINLVQLSTYLEGALNHKIKSGILDFNLAVYLSNDNIDIKNDITLIKLKVNKLKNDEIEKFADNNDTELNSQNKSASSLPLGLALKLLQNDKGKIHLKLPMSGPFGDPKISMNYLLGVIIRKSITEAVINYYSPFGMLALSKAIYKGVTRLEFQPLIFVPGSTNLSLNQNENLEKLINLLHEKDNLSLIFCPIISQKDLIAITAKEVNNNSRTSINVDESDLINLANKRFDSIKEYLLVHGVNPSQVVNCKPEINPKLETNPSINIYL